MQPGPMALDELPIISDAEPRSLGNRKAAVAAYVLEIVAIAAGIDLRQRIARFGPDQSHLVKARVAQGRHEVAVSRTASMNLDVDAQRLREMSDLERAGDAEIVFRVGSQEISASLNQ